MFGRLAGSTATRDDGSLTPVAERARASAASYFERALSRSHDLLRAAECWVGNSLTRQLCSHHRRRLQNIGWESALDAPPRGWAEHGAVPRPGNLVNVLVDGAQEHLELPVEQISHDPVKVIDDLWRPIAGAQFAGREADLPLTHRLVRLQGLSKRKYRLLGPLTGIVVDT